MSELDRCHQLRWPDWTAGDVGSGGTYMIIAEVHLLNRAGRPHIDSIEPSRSWHCDWWRQIASYQPNYQIVHGDEHERVPVPEVIATICYIRNGLDPDWHAQLKTYRESQIEERLCSQAQYGPNNGCARKDTG